MLRDGIRSVLESAGHQVVGESADLTTALGELLRLSPEVLLLDLNLGQRSGLELLTAVIRIVLPAPIFEIEASIGNSSPLARTAVNACSKPPTWRTLARESWPRPVHSPPFWRPP